jgi:hypothetical protein
MSVVTNAPDIIAFSFIEIVDLDEDNKKVVIRFGDKIYEYKYMYQYITDKGDIKVLFNRMIEEGEFKVLKWVEDKKKSLIPEIIEIGKAKFSYYLINDVLESLIRLAFYPEYVLIPMGELPLMIVYVGNESFEKGKEVFAVAIAPRSY